MLWSVEKNGGERKMSLFSGSKYLVLIGLILLTASGALAEPTGSILGRVTDAKTGVVLPDADVFILDTKKNAVTDENGYFVIENVPVGTYTLKVKIIGYKVSEKTEATVNQGRTTIQDCKLELKNPPLEGSTTIVSTGKITGKVEDEGTWEGLPMAKVVIVGTKISVTTDLDGKFTIENVPGGTYRLEATMVGFKSSVAKRVLVIPGKTTVKKLRLEMVVLKNFVFY